MEITIIDFEDAKSLISFFEMMLSLVPDEPRNPFYKFKLTLAVSFQLTNECS
jgi:hypothetical protein